ncbi:hypothetical protein F5876DRAFT_69766 [Lentinula aff. lateritia]|uniref:Uncharacterized protein n=1 Tax=Lentinula aff. lateritia TaxID=2804960 RepID=A0ACC1TLN5_9AGAR|nr:hypothetical protein F5876DRAFT_69766 [Lentinula aff. lateritia]
MFNGKKHCGKKCWPVIAITELVKQHPRNSETHRLLFYCSAQYQRSHFADHRLICKACARNKLQHVTFGTVPHGFAYPLSQPEWLYISCMLIEIVSGLNDDMITLIKERDLVSQPSAIVVDLVIPSYPISVKFTRELMAEIDMICGFLALFLVSEGKGFAVKHQKELDNDRKSFEPIISVESNSFIVKPSYAPPKVDHRPLQEPKALN